MHLRTLIICKAGKLSCWNQSHILEIFNNWGNKNKCGSSTPAHACICDKLLVCLHSITCETLYLCCDLNAMKHSFKIYLLKGQKVDTFIWGVFSFNRKWNTFIMWRTSEKKIIILRFYFVLVWNEITFRVAQSFEGQASNPMVAGSNLAPVFFLSLKSSFIH